MAFHFFIKLSRSTSYIHLVLDGSQNSFGVIHELSQVQMEISAAQKLWECFCYTAVPCIEFTNENLYIFFHSRFV